MVWRALLDPRWFPDDPEDKERLRRYNIYKVAEKFNVLPSSVEDMDWGWYQDVLLFIHTDDVVAKVKKPNDKS